MIKTVSIPSGISLTDFYREKVGNYPKFFKMDTLCKLGFLLGELIAREEPDRFTPREDRAVLVFSRAGCVANDRRYAASMADFPSPALFVYTLPNTVTGEIAIRNRWGGETSAYVLEQKDTALMKALVAQAFQDRCTQSAFVAWIDCPSDEEWTAEACLIDKNDL